MTHIVACVKCGVWSNFEAQTRGFCNQCLSKELEVTAALKYLRTRKRRDGRWQQLPLFALEDLRGGNNY